MFYGNGGTDNFSNSTPQALRRLEQAGARITHVSERYGIVTSLIVPSHLAALGRVAGVRFVQEALAPGRRGAIVANRQLGVVKEGMSSCSPGEIVGEGVAIVHADTARSEFGVDGAGVTVGVLADSYDVETTTSVDAVNDVAATIILDSVSGNVGMNLASGVGNVQSNSITIARPF